MQAKAKEEIFYTIVVYSFPWAYVAIHVYRGTTKQSPKIIVHR